MKEFKSNSKFSDVITLEEMDKWKGNVILNGGTGSGKTTLILEKLIPLKKDKSFLYLVNRTKLLEQIERDIERLQLNNISVKTYQWLDTCIKNDYSIKEYDYIICDEFHYCVEDSTFNELTGNSFNYIVNGNTPAIFMSATCEMVFNLFVHHEVVPDNQHYYIPKTYDYVNDFVFFTHKNDIELIIEDVLENTNDKIVFFTHSLELGLNVYNQFKYVSTFYCSDNANSSEAIKIRDKTVHKLMNDTFNSRVLITTTALDNGINLIDRDIKHVICSMYNINQLEQCIGRKRIIDSNDSCSFYFYERNIGMFNNVNRYEYESLFPLTVRKMKGVIDNHELDIITGYDLADRHVNGIGFKKYLVNELRFDNRKVIDYKDIKKENNSMKLEHYLDNIVGERLFKDERNILIDKVGLKDSRGRIQKSIKQINAYLEENNFPYILENNTDNRRKIKDSNNINYKKVYWIIGKKIFNR